MTIAQRTLLLLLPLLLAIRLPAQDIAGRWTSIDDETGKARSIVEIPVKNGIATGRIVQLLDNSQKDVVCNKCTDDRKNAPILGLEIIRGLKQNGKEWGEGTVLDPENGKLYGCKLWVENGDLKMRGYLGFFYRTQTWKR